MKDTTLVLPEETILALIKDTAEEDRPQLENILLNHLPEQEREDYQQIVAGKRLPTFMSDVMAKRLFDADGHKDRLEYLLREVSGDQSISVDKSYRNEGYIQSLGAKKVIFDIPAWFVDGRLGDLEFQVSAQNYVFQRGELYGSNLLMLQYSVGDNQKKSELGYEDVKGVVFIMLMRHSPEIFRAFESDRYVHRFTNQTADSGLTYKPLVASVYVQLDKCLKQFQNEEDGENNRRLQLMLSLLADSNDPKVLGNAGKDPMLSEMVQEAREVSQEKEVQAMLLAEKYAAADINAVKSYERNEGLREGRREGRREGGNTMLYGLVSKNKLSIKEAAEEANMSEETFRNNMIACGYKLP